MKKLIKFYSLILLSLFLSSCTFSTKEITNAFFVNDYQVYKLLPLESITVNESCYFIVDVDEQLSELTITRENLTTGEKLENEVVDLRTYRAYLFYIDHSNYAMPETFESAGKWKFTVTGKDLDENTVNSLDCTIIVE